MQEQIVLQLVIFIVNVKVPSEQLTFRHARGARITGITAMLLVFVALNLRSPLFAIVLIPLLIFGVRNVLAVWRQDERWLVEKFCKCLCFGNLSTVPSTQLLL